MQKEVRTKTYHKIEYQIIRSSRKTLALNVTCDGRVLVRAPANFSEKKIDAFVREKEDWILANIERQRSIFGDVQKLTADELENLTAAAKTTLPGLVAVYADRMDIDCPKVAIRHQKTRWGSYSESGTLSLNCMLMLLPPEVMEYVIVHELCHIKQMNHSALFWDEVEHYLPDYKKSKTWLAKNGLYIMAKNP